MLSLTNFITKYHTYVVAAVAALTVLVQVIFPSVSIPEWVYVLEGAVGLGSIRMTVSGVQPAAQGGWKTYASAVALAAVAGLQAYQVLPPDVLNMIMGVISAAGLGSLTAAVRKTET